MKQPVTSDRLAPAIGPFSPGVLDGHAIYTSGQVAQDPQTGLLIKGGVAAQTRQIFNNIEALLAAAGKTLADVIKVNVYLTDMNDFHEMNGVYASRFEQPYPARTTVAVRALPLGASVEIEVIAR